MKNQIKSRSNNDRIVCELDSSSTRPAQVLNCQMYPLSLLLFLSLQLGFLSLSSIPPTTFASRNLLQTGNGSCPLNFGLLQRLFDGSRRPNLDVTTECLYVRQTLRLVQSEYLRLTGSFLPPIDSAESCWSSYQTLVDEFVPNFNPRRSCGFETLWIAEGCMNITTRDEFESTVPRSVLNEVVLACNQSLDNGSPCTTCTTRLSTLQAEYLTGGSIGNIYDCTAYPLIYAAAFANDFGPTDKGTGKCLFSLHFTPSSNNKQRNNKQLKVVIIVVVVVGGFVLFVVLGGGLFMRRRHKKLIEKRKIARNNTSTELGSGLDSITGSTTVIRFTFDEIKVATKNFSRGNIIGRGGYGNVYKGVLTDGSEVALKRFKNCSAAGDATFAHEVEVIASVRHINLVGLRGYCTATTPFEGPPEVMEKYVMVAVLCSHPQLYARPTMDQVVKILERNEPVPSIPERPIPLIAGIDDTEKSVSSGSGHLSTSGGCGPTSLRALAPGHLPSRLCFWELTTSFPGVTHPGIYLVQARLTSEFSWDPKPLPFLHTREYSSLKLPFLHTREYSSLRASHPSPHGNRRPRRHTVLCGVRSDTICNDPVPPQYDIFRSG
ncbi:hypothetical protein LguiA_029732 [Lonicera macranthoides]